MCFNVAQEHDCVIGQIGPENVRKFAIQNKQKPEFLLRLREMNITRPALFPGVDGLGHSAKELISLGPLYPLATRRT